MIFSLTSAYAADDNDTVVDDVQTGSSTQDSMDMQSSEDNSFTSLNEALNNAGEEISITKDYVFDSDLDTDFSNGISIVNRTLKINGNNHTIDGLSIPPIFNLENSEVEIYNLTLKNSVKNSVELEYSVLTTRNVVFDGENQESRAVYMTNSLYLSDGDTFINTYREYGSAIYGSDSYLGLNNATFVNERDNVWGLIYLYNCEVNITNTAFNNITSKYSAALSGGNVTGIIENCTFSNLNVNLTAGAIGLESITEELTIQNCSFKNLLSLKNGGAIYLDISGFDDADDNEGVVFINDCEFFNCVSSFGGALLQLGGTLYIDNSQFIYNYAEFKGGAVYTSFANVTMTDSVFKDNEVSLLDESYNQGGAIYFDYGNLTVSNSTFLNSTANEGESIFANDANYSISDSYFENSIYTYFDGEITELNNNVFVDEKKNTFNDTPYYLYYEGEGIQLDIDPYIIGEGNFSSEYFNLADYGLVSPVKNQGDNGACWAFATTGSLESALLRATNKKVLWDVSENNIQNIGLRYSFVGETLTSESGTIERGMSYLLSWLGITSADDDEYDELGKISAIIDNGSKCYVYETVYLPLYNNTNISTYKEALIKYGAIALCINGASVFEEDKYNEETAASYINESLSIDHGVVLVGWNDTFSRYNFKVTPPGDGAWILKNSYGTEWGDNGYYYVSYYDKTIGTGKNPIAIVINNSANRYEKNYQYDPTARVFYNAFPSDEIISYMNTFNITEDDLLAAVGTYFKEADVEYMIEIETEDYIYQQEGISKHAGYETIPLNKLLPIHEGTQVTVKIYADDVPITAYYRNHVPENVSFINTTRGLTCISAEGCVACLKAYTIKDYSYMESDNLTTRYGSEEYIQVKYYDENGEELINATVKFSIDDNIYERVTDENGIATLNITLPVGKYTVTITNPINLKNNTVTWTILSDGSKPENNSQKRVNSYHKNSKQSAVTYMQSQSNNLYKILLNNHVIIESDVLTLDGLNKIFNQSFINGTLLVYLDGKLVFNNTVSDDLSTVIFEILEKFLGDHELKVVFTDAGNKSNTYVENITIF